MLEERSLILLKPEVYERGLMGEILSRIEKKGFRILAMKMVVPTPDILKKHYHEHVNKEFFKGLSERMSAGPVIAICLGGLDVIASMRKMIGATKPHLADPGTLRFDYGCTMEFNLVHGSDSAEAAELEIGTWFTESELVTNQRLVDSKI